MLRILSYLFLIASIVLFTCFYFNNDISSVRIGEQEWMSNNLDVIVYLNGDTIPHIQDAEAWSNQTKGAWCYVDVNKKFFGKVYNWYAVDDPRGLAPIGWEIPNKEQWSELINYLGGYEKAARKLKSSSGWKGSGDGINSSKMNCFPGAGRSSTGIVFGSIGGNVGFWTSSDVNQSTSAKSINLDYYSSKVYSYKVNKKNGFYIRCVKN